MRKQLFFAAIAAISGIGLASCSKSEINTPDSHEAFTHEVTINIDTPETRTSIVEESSSASFLWSSDDASRFTVKENNSAATKVDLTLSDGNKKAAIKATFESTTASSYEYSAFMATSKSSENPKIPTEQKPTASSYDPDADILVAEPLTFDSAQSELNMRFTRPVVINKMTLKGLTAEEKVSTVIITGDKNLTGTYNTSSASWSGGNDYIKLTVNQKVPTSGELPIYFVTMPVDDVTLNVNVLTNAKDYSKAFTKTISFKADQVTVFGVSGWKAETFDEYKWNDVDWLNGRGIALPETGKGTNFEENKTVSQENTAMNFIQNGETEKTRLYNSSGSYDLRTYNGALFSVSCYADKVIEKILFEGSGLTSMKALEGTYDTGTWTGLSQSVTFLVDGGVNIKTVKVFYRTATSDDHWFAIPVPFVSLTHDATSANIPYKALNIDDLQVSCTDSDVEVFNNQSWEQIEVTLPANTASSMREITINVSSAAAGYTGTINIEQAGAPMKISSITKTESGLTVTGQVAAISSKGFILADETGEIFVYTDSKPSYSIGQTVTVVGDIAVYNNGLQFSQPEITEGSAGSYEYGTAASFTSTEINAYNSNTANRLAKYVTFTGTLQKSGTHYNFIVGEGTEANATLYYQTTTMTSFADGDNLTVTGYAIAVMSGRCAVIPVEITNNETAPKLVFEDITGVDAAGVTDATLSVKPYRTSGWTASVTATGCVSAASISTDNKTITYSVSANENTTEATGTIKVTYSKGSETVEYVINVTQNKKVSGTSVTLSISDHAKSNSWENGTAYSPIVIDDNIEMSINLSGNNGKYYSANDSWRAYETNNAKITITAKNSKELKSITFTYANGNYGCIVYNGSNYITDSVITLSGKTADFSVTHTSGTKSGNIQITKVVVVYE